MRNNLIWQVGKVDVCGCGENLGEGPASGGGLGGRDKWPEVGGEERRTERAAEDIFDARTSTEWTVSREARTVLECAILPLVRLFLTYAVPQRAMCAWPKW